MRGVSLIHVFVRDFTHIHVPYAKVRAGLLQGDSAWIASAAVSACDQGEEMVMRLGPHAEGGLSKRVRVHLGRAYSRSGGMVVPINWVATGTPGLFPEMDADLEVEPIDHEMTQLTISGLYRPPLGAVGRTLDALVLHRLAEASVRCFLQQLAQRLAGEQDGSVEVREGDAPLHDGAAPLTRPHYERSA